MDIIKATEVKPDLKKILILGVPFSGKTSVLSTLPRPLLVFAGDVSVERRLAGQKDVDIVKCYYSHGESETAGIERFDKNFTELLTMKQITYKTVAFDPFNFLYDDKLMGYFDVNRGNKQGAYGDLLEYGGKVLKRAVGLPDYVVVICHTKYGVIDSYKKETTNKRGEPVTVSMPIGEPVNHPAVPGGIKNTFAGKFDAVFYTQVKERPSNTPLYSLRWLPDSEYQCGAKVPIGFEHMLKGSLEPDLSKLIAKLQGEFEKKQKEGGKG